MQSTSLRSALGVLACLLVLVIGTPTPAWAQQPPSSSIPLPTPVPSVPPTPAPSPGINPEESIPVVIRYGQNQETRVQVYRGLMEPAGVPAAQGVTVTVLLPATYAGQIVRLGLYDGGQVWGVALPGQDINDRIDLRALLAAADGSVRFNFKAGATFGLYRVLVTVGPAQFLLQFYAVRPRPTSDPVPTPNPPPIG